MDLSWSVLALALLGAEDQPPSKPKPPSFPIAVEIRIKGPAAAQAGSCCRDDEDDAEEPCPVVMRNLLKGVVALIAERAGNSASCKTGSCPQTACSGGSSLPT